MSSKKEKELIKEVKQLRKQLFKMTNPDSLDNVQNVPEIPRNVCTECGNPMLSKTTFNRPDGSWSFSICKGCGHRTELIKI